MEKVKSIRQMISDEELPLGLIMDIPSPEIAEVAGLVGCNFVRVDMDHGIYNLETVSNVIRAADTVDLDVIVRVSDISLVTSLLDFGVAGIMAPRVRTKIQAQKLVDKVKYSPTGSRGMREFGRAQKFGKTKMIDYIDKANEETLLIITIEDKEGIENSDEILSVNGIDMVDVGRAGLSQAVGLPGQLNHPEVLELENSILETAQRNGVGFQLTSNSLEEAKTFINRGLRSITIDNDVSIMGRGVEGTVKNIRNLVE